MRDSLPSTRYSPVCNVLRQRKTSLILTYRVYQLYDEISNLTTSSLICTPCYKIFTSIIQEVNPIKTQNASDPNQTIDANVTTLRQNIQLLQLKGEYISKEVYEMILYGVADKLHSFNEV